MQPLNCVRVLGVEPVDGVLVLLRLPLQLLQPSPQLGLLPLVQLVCFIKLDHPSSGINARSRQYGGGLELYRLEPAAYLDVKSFIFFDLFLQVLVKHVLGLQSVL